MIHIIAELSTKKMTKYDCQRPGDSDVEWSLSAGQVIGVHRLDPLKVIGSKTELARLGAVEKVQEPLSEVGEVFEEFEVKR